MKDVVDPDLFAGDDQSAAEEEGGDDAFDTLVDDPLEGVDDPVLDGNEA